MYRPAGAAARMRHGARCKARARRVERVVPQSPRQCGSRVRTRRFAGEARAAGAARTPPPRCPAAAPSSPRRPPGMAAATDDADDDEARSLHFLFNPFFFFFTFASAWT